MTTSYDRYAGLLGHKFVWQPTRAACGQLITAAARLDWLLAISRAHGHVDGPVTRHQWVTFADGGREALRVFDEAWSQYLAEMTPETAEQADAQLRAGVLDALRKMEDLVARFPARESLMDW